MPSLRGDSCPPPVVVLVDSLEALSAKACSVQLRLLLEAPTAPALCGPGGGGFCSCGGPGPETPCSFLLVWALGLDLLSGPCAIVSGVIASGISVEILLAAHSW